MEFYSWNEIFQKPIPCRLGKIAKHAWDDTYDIGVLLSGDRDFIPAVRFLNRRGKKIINASFGNPGYELASECWKQIDLSRFASQLEFK